MTVIGWVQIALYVALILALTRPLGGFLTRVVTGERTLFSPVLVPVERLLYRVAGVDPRVEHHWLTYAVAMLLFNLAGLVVLYATAAPAGNSAAQSAGNGGGAAGSGVQHRHQLRHQHQLAELRRRNDDELPDADGRARRCRTSSPPRPASRSRSR